MNNIERKSHNLEWHKKLAFFAMVIGMFMAILDIQIVASSLSVIGAGLSASIDELSWIQTSYLMAEVIIIPISGFIARCLSTRVTFFISALGFTIMSILCATAWNIESMIIFRALQGFFGGCMIPTVFSTIYLIFPPQKRPSLTILIGLVVTVAPTIGPTLGGYMTELFSWQALFLLNVLPGIFVCIVIYLYANFDQPNYTLLKNFDYIGIALMSFTLAILQYILEEGNHKGWMESNLLLVLSILITITFISFIIHELTFINPIVDLSTFANKNFTLGCIYSFITGIGLFGAVFLLPLFLFSIANFNTIQIGTTMMITGIAQFISAPIAGRLLGKTIDFRLMLAAGLLLFGSSCYINSFLTPDSRTIELLIPQILRGLSLMFCFLPTNQLALGMIKKSQIQNASSLYNLIRNLGGAIGLAIINNLLFTKRKIASSYLRESITETSPYKMFQLESINNLLSTTNGDIKMSNYFLDTIIEKNAFIIAINDIFIIIALLFFICILTLPLINNVTLSNNDSH